MLETVKINEFKVEKASESIWDDILSLLKDTRLNQWFTGKETYKDFFAIYNSNNELISCFAINKNKDIGILKSFAIKSSIQKKGVGSYIANTLIPKVAKELNIKKLYLLGGNKAPFTSLHFWEKTHYKQIDENKFVDQYFQEYLDNIKDKYPEHFFREAAFELNIN
ncbi:MAG: GNAT family N-acetyltransferase [Candidatus Melainabacteria bacterium]|nr:GNAT family N-acetyltransferase [Candidatus Melainabacteria bacterium]MBI3309372.1 GNAT family N-acetyltransferase [Candidatus Melainabacteria bacterium]